MNVFANKIVDGGWIAIVSETASGAVQWYCWSYCRGMDKGKSWRWGWDSDLS